MTFTYRITDIEIYRMEALMARIFSMALIHLVAVTTITLGQTIRGRVVDQAGEDVANARITLFSADTVTFIEVHSDSDGRFGMQLGSGSYRLGVSAKGYDYVERTLILDPSSEVVTEVVLNPETQRGLWTLVGDPGERLGGTNSASLLPNGHILYCHDTQDPVIFDPVKSDIHLAAKSQRLQGCHAVSLLPDGRLIFVGGTDQEVYGPGTRQVKTYDYRTDTWMVQPEIIDYRWYPTMTSLADGQLLLTGGGGLDNPQRVATSEILNPESMLSRVTGSIAVGNEVSPVALLFDGRVLMTHRPPQIFDPKNGLWSLASDFVRGSRMPNGDHSDHEITVMSDGRVVAVGYKPFGAVRDSSFVEIYDPSIDSWSVGTYFAPLRSRVSIVTLPTDEILVIGGEKEVASDPTPTNRWNNVALTDLYDPERDAWRRLADLNIAREYHTTPILVPDGRIVTVGGEGAPGNEPAQSTIEIFSPPYLFRGIRPRITSLATTSMELGASVPLSYDRTRRPTAVKLLGCSANTHFMESGPNRSLTLDFVGDNGELILTLPNDSRRVPPGYYMLFIMTDEIPSYGRMVRIGSTNTNTVQIDEHRSPSAFIKELYSGSGSSLRHIRIQLPYVSRYRLDVVDATGKLIGEIESGGDGEGSLDVEWDATSLSTGAYFYRLRWSGEAVTLPFRVLK